MSFDLKISLLPTSTREALSSQHKKLNQLIEKIEQQKQDLQLWQNAQSKIQTYLHQKLVPIYRDLHVILFNQLEQLWLHLQQGNFSKTDLEQLDSKLTQLAKQLKKSPYLNTAQLQTVAEVDTFYQQHQSHNKSKKTKKSSILKSDQTFENEIKDQYSDIDHAEYDADQFEDWDSNKFQREREEHQRKRIQQKREQAEKLAEQSLKTVYLKITAMIHPDREPDEVKKLEKTELQQVVNQAYEEQDLFYLLKLQLQLETHQGKSPKALTDEHLKFYKMALEAQSQRLASQIDDIIDGFHWSEKPNPKNMQVKDVYKVIDADVVILKEQVKWEKERLKFIGKVKGLEVLLESGVL